MGVRDSFMFLWIVVDRCGLAVAGCGSLWMVVGRCGWLWIIPHFSMYGERYEPDIIPTHNIYLNLCLCRNKR